MLLTSDGHAFVEQSPQLFTEAGLVPDALMAERASHLKIHDRFLQDAQIRKAVWQPNIGQSGRNGRHGANRLIERASRIRVGSIPIGRAAQTDARRSDFGQTAQPTVAGEHGGEQTDIPHTAPKSADGVQRLRQAFHARSGDAAQRRLVAHDTAVGGRTDD